MNSQGSLKGASEHFLFSDKPYKGIGLKVKSTTADGQQ